MSTIVHWREVGGQNWVNVVKERPLSKYVCISTVGQVSFRWKDGCCKNNSTIACHKTAPTQPSRSRQFIKGCWQLVGCSSISGTRPKTAPLTTLCLYQILIHREFQKFTIKVDLSKKPLHLLFYCSFEICFLIKFCAAEKRTHVKKLNSLSSKGFVVNTPQLFTMIQMVFWASVQEDSVTHPVLRS